MRKNGRLHATPLLVALVAIETTDLAFAVDSIPAVFAVTRDPFLVYTSNVFALLGLRSLYVVLIGAIQSLRFLRTALGIMQRSSRRGSCRAERPVSPRTRP